MALRLSVLSAGTGEGGADDATGSLMAAAVSIRAVTAGMRERGAGNAIQMRLTAKNAEKDIEGMEKGYMGRVTHC